MAIYSIRDLEKLTGIKTHTIRVWEQRYNFMEAPRTPTNIRYYTDEHLRLMFNISLLLKNGYKISKIAPMKPEDIADCVSANNLNDRCKNTLIDELALAAIQMEEAKFENILRQYDQENGGFERVMLDLIYPFLNRLNVLWFAKSICPCNEKFVSNLIRRKLMSAIEGEANTVGKHQESFVLYAPEGETQDLTLLFMHYLLRKRGFKVIYLGMNTQTADLRDVCTRLKPDYVFTILHEPLQRSSVQAYIDSVANVIGGSTLLVTGQQAFNNPVKAPEHTRILNGFADTIALIDGL